MLQNSGRSELGMYNTKKSSGILGMNGGGRLRR